MAKKVAWYIKDLKKAASVEQAGTFAPRKRGVAEAEDADGDTIRGYGVVLAGIPVGAETT